MAEETSTGSTGSGSGTTRRRSAAAPKRTTSRASAPTSTRSTAPAKSASSAVKAATKPAAKPAAKVPATTKKTEVIVVPAAFDAHKGPMTPAVAVTRHLEWLEYALAAARAEESWRRGRLDKATKKNRAKRENRLAEVVAEITELAALLVGLRALKKPAAARKPAARRSTSARKTRAGTAAGASSQAATAAGPR